MKKILFFILTILTFNFRAQNADRFWSPVSESAIKRTGTRQIVPQKYVTMRLVGTALKEKLFSAPLETSVKINESNCIITLPLPNGTMQQFRVVEAPIMEPGLAKQFPDFKTFSVKGIDDPNANGKLDWNENGFHGMVRTVNGDFFIDPYCVGNTTDYITYYTADFVKGPSQVLPEAGVVKNPNTPKKQPSKKKESQGRAINATPGPCVGDQLRTYRLAVACTGEYAVAATGSATPTMAQTLGKIMTSVNRVDGVYETEVAIRMVLVATETNVVYMSASTDPFTGNNNANVLIGESQTVITNNIGSANFDIGHTFSTGGGGLAGLGVVCDDSQKASGITGSPSPVGDPYDIDYVAHEMGHEFGGNHTFNATTGSCGGGNVNPTTAVEPGSGITIMAYAGICGSTNDLAAHSIPYFHAISYDEIIDYTYFGFGSTCPVTTTTTNHPPVVTGSGNYLVPLSTAFALTGSATDPDGDALTYSWEETDVATVNGNWNTGSSPFFRSYNPVTSPTRYFPNPTVMATGNYTATKGEYVPQSIQTLEFRLTARDGGGGVCYAINTVSISGAAGPFEIFYPSAANIIWASGSQQTIVWSVNATDQPPMSCDSVRILISMNGGTSYSVLTNSTPNDGSQVITAPTVTNTITTCRIKVEAKGNIFLDISNNNFTISNSVGFAEVSQNNPVGLNVWPNPTNGEIHVVAGDLNPASVTNLKVIDILGKTVLTTNYSGKQDLHETIDLSGLSQGVYFIKLANNNKHAVYRVVKD